MRITEDIARMDVRIFQEDLLVYVVKGILFQGTTELVSVS